MLANVDTYHVPVSGAHTFAVRGARAPAGKVVVFWARVVMAVVLSVAAVVVVRVVQVIRLRNERVWQRRIRGHAIARRLGPAHGSNIGPTFSPTRSKSN